MTTIPPTFNAYVITWSGVLLTISGIILIVIANKRPEMLPYFMPLPPICVSCYIFVSNIYKQQVEQNPSGFRYPWKEIGCGLGYMAGSIIVMTLLLSALACCHMKSAKRNSFPDSTKVISETK